MANKDEKTKDGKFDKAQKETAERKPRRSAEELAVERRNRCNGPGHQGRGNSCVLS